MKKGPRIRFVVFGSVLSSSFSRLISTDFLNVLIDLLLIAENNSLFIFNYILNSFASSVFQEKMRKKQNFIHKLRKYSLAHPIKMIISREQELKKEKKTKT